MMDITRHCRISWSTSNRPLNLRSTNYLHRGPYILFECVSAVNRLNSNVQKFGWHNGFITCKRNRITWLSTHPAPQGELTSWGYAIATCPALCSWTYGLDPCCWNTTVKGILNVSQHSRRLVFGVVWFSRLRFSHLTDWTFCHWRAQVPR